ncbi:tetratricopeptide repeat protein [Streptomyces sp. 7-21]|uniref:tetratricopeptide repeat protein n=1 Tax=Streptomyces sp. 7-21 TaxID=2802283 RepID=UPI00191F4D98|nr:tetratricopeptide repeat protein [Streptomyces sp. 7-21]MBL1065655.1 sel1 repeat family protein [Streptomyces sp. 7-21]
MTGAADRARRMSRVQNTAHGVRGPVVQAGEIHGGVWLTLPETGRHPLRALSGLPAARDWDPFLAGVHRARTGPGGTGLPAYVPRDIDGELRRLVRESAAHGGLVLLVGPSTAGKTRAAFEAVRDVLPDHRVLAPDPGSDLTQLPGLHDAERDVAWLLWLDDLQSHLGPDALSPVLLDWLTGTRVPVVATLRTQYYRELRESGEALGMRVVNAARPLLVSREWSSEERRRAEATGDPLLAQALPHRDFGVSEYLAAGPELLREWRSARIPAEEGGHPRGHALVAAAVDLARTGLASPVPRRLLDLLHVTYLAGMATLRPEPLDEAWAWAVRQRLGAASLLVPGDLEQSVWRAFDYLVDEAPPARDVPELVWDTALDQAKDGEERWLVGRTAWRSGHPRVAESAWLPLAEAGDTRAMSDLAELLRARGDLAGADAWLARAADAESDTAMYELGLEYLRQSPYHRRNAFGTGFAAVRARYWFRRAAQAGHVEAMYQLGRLPGRWDGTDEGPETWLRRAAEAGHARAMTELARRLRRDGDREGAAAWLARAAAALDPEGMHLLAASLRERGDEEAAEAWFAAAAGAGYPRAAHALSALLRARGDAEGAARMLERAVRRERRAITDTVAAYTRQQGL